MNDQYMAFTDVTFSFFDRRDRSDKLGTIPRGARGRDRTGEEVGAEKRGEWDTVRTAKSGRKRKKVGEGERERERPSAETYT